MATKNAPGKFFRKGISLIELFEMFPDDATAEAWFVKSRWPEGVRCAHCDGDNVSLDSKHPTMPYHCRGCRLFFSAKTDTVMHSSKLGYRKWALAIYIVTTGIKGTSSMKLHRDLEISQKTGLALGPQNQGNMGKRYGQLVFWACGSRRNLHRRQGIQQALQQEAPGRAWDDWQDRRSGNQRQGD